MIKYKKLLTKILVALSLGVFLSGCGKGINEIPLPAKEQKEYDKYLKSHKEVYNKKIALNIEKDSSIDDDQYKRIIEVKLRDAIDRTLEQIINKEERSYSRSLVGLTSIGTKNRYIC